MTSTGGGYKVKLLKEALQDYQDDQDKIVLFTDSYDVIFLSGLEEIINRFRRTKARILFSAEGHCWPDRSLASKYPPVTRGKRFLNSGSFIGYASDVYAIITYNPIKNKDDDQLFYTKAYLDVTLREQHKIKLDHKSDIFQNLYAAVADVELKFEGGKASLMNTVYNTEPLILHGNGRSKLSLNSLGNYLAQAWNPEEGCVMCWEETIELDKTLPETYPVLVIAIFIERPTPFLEEFFMDVYKLLYPKSKLHLFVHINVKYHQDTVDRFMRKYATEYRSSKQILASDRVDEVDARNIAMDYCLLKECDGYFSIDSVAHLDNDYTLKLLVEQQRGIVAPLLVRPYKMWSNFWGAIMDDGFYARSFDYMEIVKNERRGLWNVPFVSNCYLINATLIRNKATRPSYSERDLDTDMAFAHANRERSIFMYVNNRVDFGHLVNPDNYDISLTNPDLYQNLDNKLDWEKRYLHEDYSENFNPEKTPVQPCPDVYWFPIVNERYTKELVEVMEAYGKWSDGTNNDPRLSGGYENVPTRDIHMTQVNYESQWLYFLKEYVRPLQEFVFTGYFHDDPRIDGGYEAVPTRDVHMRQVGLHESWSDFLIEYVGPLQEHVFVGYYTSPPRALMNFVVRYRPDEQPSLKPHHDSSTYTVNIALNRAGVDYEGGGCRFIRYNCSVTDTKPGWMLMHPGRLTHYHEGLRVTNGTRYIMISFVDP
ncbi:Procollagen-lysine,2-oxoglutarate 5-dioxygenase 1 [Dufourea novaeangliae]|uniref:Procollagen-lysine,2-oxoglutarate 5-dioxygenase 1 n=1 Tax=Dufourea novaeangliae TaxID=178035 RepID=A0A154PB61_DUFNO|nr:Procollagen-lysine,2-oxoglutarate 5-dioxygenase 1 [Dufourea novaeangliae]